MILNEDYRDILLALNAERVDFILNDLIVNKRATGRPKDRIDVDELKKLKGER